MRLLINTGCVNTTFSVVYYASPPSPPLPKHTHMSTCSDEQEALESWDPRKFDYESTTFNSYISGPGALLPSPSAGSGPKPVSIFVDNIPDTCSKVRHQTKCACVCYLELGSEISLVTAVCIMCVCV